jgi:hypothetical protein
MAAAVKPFLSAIDGEYLFVSAMTRAFVDIEARVQRLDLIDQTREAGTSRAGAEVAANRVAAAIQAGTPVYYLSTHFEQGDDFQGEEGLGEYKLYFIRLSEQFDLTAVYVSPFPRTGEHLWILYKVEARGLGNEGLAASP